MGFFFPKSEKRSDPLIDPNHPVWRNISLHTKSGVNVTEESSIRYATVFSCVTLISGDIAGLPLILYRKTSSGKERMTDHPAYGLCHDAPNPEMTSFNWRETGQGHACLWGNHYSLIERSRFSGKVVGLWPIENPGVMKISREQDTKRLVYEWVDTDGNQQKRYKQDIFHVPGFSFNGLKGLSNIGLARESIGLGLALDEFGSRFFGQGMNMAGIISIEHDLGDRAKAYIDNLKSQYSGLGNSHGVMVLQNGEKYQQLAMPLDDAQFIESRKFQKSEICSIYHVPPHKVGIYEKNSNRSNLEQENQGYIDSALMHWIRRWEAALNMQVLTEKDRKAGFYFEFLLDGMLRGDSQARADYYQKIWQVGGISPNEIRARENMNPINGGDTVYVPMNFIPADKAGQQFNEPAVNQNEDVTK